MVSHAKVRRVEDRRWQELWRWYVMEERLKALVVARDFAGAANLKAEMQKQAEALVASVKYVAAARDRHRRSGWKRW